MSSNAIVNDIIFKAIFAKEKNKYLLIFLLNALLDYTGNEKITEISILNPFIDRNFIDDKLLILDIKAKDGSGKLYNIEVQVNPPKSYINRAVLYLARLFSEQIGKGEEYSKLPKTIGISIITGGILFKKTEEIHNIYHFKNLKTDHELTDILELHFIELEKFDKLKPFDLGTRFEKWLYILKFGEYFKTFNEKIPIELEEEEGITMAIEEYQKVISDDYIRELILAKEKARMDMKSYIAEALTEGREEMRIKGREEGRMEGQKERSIEMALTMLKGNEPLEKIIQYTGLTENEIKSINL